MDIPRDISLKSEEVNIFLRPPVLEDVDSIYRAVMASQAELSVWMDWCTPDYSKDLTIEWVNQQSNQWAEDNNYQFAIFDSRQGSLLGLCGINHINRYYKLGNLGYWVRTDQTGKGIATQAAQLVARFGFEYLELRRIEILTGVENLASRKVAEKAGAVFEGILRKRIIQGGRSIDAAMHSLVPEDFPELGSEF